MKISRTLKNCRVELAASELASPDKPAKVHIYARSVKEISRFCGVCEYEDFDGMNAPDVISLNVEHDVDRTIGKAFNFKRTDYGLECDAEIYPSLPAENADGQRVINMLKIGVPLQASITFDVDNYKDVEEIDEGKTAEVNGLTIEGPAAIFRRWNLRSLAICIHGADSTTGVDAISLSSEKHKEFNAMHKNRSEDAPVDDEEKKVVEETKREDEEVETPAEPESQPNDNDRLTAIEAAIDELRAAVAALQAKAESEEDPVKVEQNDAPCDADDDKDKEELSKKIDSLEIAMKQLTDKLVKNLSAANAEQTPVGYPVTDAPGSGSLRFSAIGIPSKK